MNVQKPEYKKLVNYLKHLDLNTEQSQVYLFLLTNGPNSVLGISRGLKTGRTKLYPLLEELGSKQLVTIHERHYGTSYEARPPEVLEFLVSEKERAADALRSSLPGALSLLRSVQYESPSQTKIIEYRGIDGLKQINFNLTKARNEFRVFELAGLDKHLGSHFANKMRVRIRERKLTSYDLTNNPNRDNEPGVDSPQANTRYIDPKVFKIEFESYIYDNVVALLSYKSDEIMGIEIHSDKLARQQTQIFDMLWNQTFGHTK